MRECLILEGKKLHYFECNGLKFMTRPLMNDGAIIKEVIERNFYLSHKALSIKEDSIVLDIGAHIGTFTMLAASLGAKVYSFEPNKENFELLCINTQLNEATVKYEPLLYNEAVSDFDGKGFLILDSENYGSHFLSKEESVENAEVVSVVDFGHILPSGIDFLKMDCEGSEREIIGNTMSLKHVKQISMEVHGTDTQVKEVVTALDSESFQILVEERIYGNQWKIQGVK